MNLIKSHYSPVTIVGIGRVGLPMALYLANQGYRVWGIGRNTEKMKALSQGKMPFIEKGATALLKKTVNISFFPTISYDSIRSSRVIIITIGTPVDSNMNPVLDDIAYVINTILPILSKNSLIILRSTVSPGTTEHIRYSIESKSQFRVGKNLYLAFCPERIAEGKSLEEIQILPQIIGGVEPKSTEMASLFFDKLGITTLETDARSAELAKLFTNMYRYINFAISNQFMSIAEEHDRSIHEIVHLVNDGYPRGGLALPGLTGGPCLFKDGFFLVQSNPYIDLITASWKINESTPLMLIKALKKQISLKEKKVLLLGLTFKPDIDDTRESLSHKLYKALVAEHAIITVHDPFAKTEKIPVQKGDFLPLIRASDIVIIAVTHSLYKRNIKAIRKAIRATTIVCDIWNMMGTKQILYTGKIAKKI